jgi:hypothetical protein
MSADRVTKTIRVYVGFSDDEPHFDRMAEKDRQPGYTVCKSKAACRAMYEDVREMRLMPASRKRKAK